MIVHWLGIWTFLLLLFGSCCCCSLVCKRCVCVFVCWLFTDLENYRPIATSEQEKTQSRIRKSRKIATNKLTIQKQDAKLQSGRKYTEKAHTGVLAELRCEIMTAVDDYHDAENEFR